MAVATNMLVKDNSATPVEYTFEPESDGPDYLAFRTNLSNVPLDGQLRCTLTKTPTKSGYKLTQKTEVPVLETLGASGTALGYVAPPKVAYVDTVITSQFVDKRSTADSRMNALKIHMGIAQGAGATTGLGILTNASDWKASASQIVLFFKNLIFPS